MSLFKDPFCRAVLLALIFYVFVMAIWGYGLDRNHRRGSLGNPQTSNNLRLGAAYPLSGSDRNRSSESSENPNASHNLRLGEDDPLK